MPPKTKKYLLLLAILFFVVMVGVVVFKSRPEPEDKAVDLVKQFMGLLK